MFRLLRCVKLSNIGVGKIRLPVRNLHVTTPKRVYIPDVYYKCNADELMIRKINDKIIYNQLDSMTNNTYIIKTNSQQYKTDLVFFINNKKYKTNVSVKYSVHPKNKNFNKYYENLTKNINSNDYVFDDYNINISMGSMYNLPYAKLKLEQHLLNKYAEIGIRVHHIIINDIIDFQRL